MKRYLIVILSCVIIFTVTSCTSQPLDVTKEANPQQQTVQSSHLEEQESVDESKLIVKKFDDVRIIFDGDKGEFKRAEFDPGDIVTLTFNEKTKFEGSEQLMQDIMEKGKNPGLNVKSLHDRGITGKGVNVGIIDQNMLTDHPEFEGKIVEYYDTGCDTPPDSGSMHGPAVTSLLVGDNTGVAPDARVYYAAAPSWLDDSKYFADALNWIIDINEALPENEKIRVVSVSAAPGAPGGISKNGDMWREAVDKARNSGILVIDCTDNNQLLVYPGYYDIENPDDFSKFKIGFPDSDDYFARKDVVYVPTSCRTVAEEYDRGEFSYQYTGVGGLSWGIPYALGVLALGWQVNPSLTSDEIVDILMDTCYVSEEGFKVINPVAFIDKVEGNKHEV